MLTKTKNIINKSDKTRHIQPTKSIKTTNKKTLYSLNIKFITTIIKKNNGFNTINNIKASIRSRYIKNY